MSLLLLVLANRRRSEIIFIVLLSALAALGWWMTWRTQVSDRVALDAARSSCQDQLRSEKARESALQDRFGRYVAAMSAAPDAWFVNNDMALASRQILGKLTITLTASFAITKELSPHETLVGGRMEEETRTQRTSTTASAGFLLGRRSKINFALVMASGDEPALQSPSASFFTPPGEAEVNVPNWFNHTVSYALKGTTASLDAEESGCGANPVAVVQAWRVEEKGRVIVAAVLGCQSADSDMRPISDLPLFGYEGYQRWTSLSERPLAFLRTTPQGGVSLMWGSLDREYGESGELLEGLGMPESVVAVFLPKLEAGINDPILHSMLFQVDEQSEYWVPFWALRKQLAAAPDQLDLGSVLGLAVPILPRGALDSTLRDSMLSSYRDLMNISDQPR